MATQLKFGMDKLVHPILYNGCDDVHMPGLQLMGPWLISSEMCSLGISLGFRQSCDTRTDRSCNIAY